MSSSPIAAATSASATTSTMPMLPPRSARSTAGSLRRWLRSCVTMPNRCHVSGRKALRCVLCKQILFIRSRFHRGGCPIEPHDVADHFRHRLAVLRGYFLVDLDGGVPGPGQRLIFDDRHGVRLGDFANLERHEVKALRKAYWGVHAT